jgi:hypothetical protein
MIKRSLLLILTGLFLVLPLTVWAADIPAKVYENGSDNRPIALSGVKVQIFGGYGFKALIASAESDGDGSCALNQVSLGKEVLVKLSKAGYVTQYDMRSYSEADVEKGVTFWIGSEANVQALYKGLGETLDVQKGQVYLEISNDLTGEGIEGVQFNVSSGRVFDLGQGEYLIANAEGAVLKAGIQKPGYAFDMESLAIPLFTGSMTQYYAKIQTGGAVYENGIGLKVTSAMISGFIKRLSDAQPISGVTVAFTKTTGGTTVRPSVLTDKTGFYKQTEFPVSKFVKVIPSKPPWKFRPASKTVFVGASGAKADFKGY